MVPSWELEYVLVDLVAPTPLDLPFNLTGFPTVSAA